MEVTGQKVVFCKSATFYSPALKRDFIADFYVPRGVEVADGISLLLINDGQNLAEMQLQEQLDELYKANKIKPLLAVGLHASADRKYEYGTAKVRDYLNRGSKAGSYTEMVFTELLPFIRKLFKVTSFQDKSFLGFSLGALSALDIVWAHPHEFSKVGCFSGSFWWRTVHQEHPTFDEDKHRIMHNLIKEGAHYPWLKFFFETGTQDETADRNNNGIIDAIDDTLSLIDELKKKGYSDEDIKYVELADGKHDLPTWSRTMPDFLQWGWGTAV